MPAKKVYRPSLQFAPVFTLLAPGSIDIARSRMSLDAGLGKGFGMSVDMVALPGFELGLHLHGLSRAGSEPLLASQLMYGVGLHTGPTWLMANKALFAAVIGVGYQRIVFADAMEISEGLVVHILAKVSYKVWRGVYGRLGLGLQWQPSGGHAGTGITLPPTPMLQMGLAFTLHRRVRPNKLTLGNTWVRDE